MSQKRNLSDLEKRKLTYERNLSIYNDSKTGASLRDLQEKYTSVEGVPLSRARLHEIVKTMEIYEKKNVHINPAGRLSVGEITTEIL